MPNLRKILAFAIPSVAGIFGILWFLVRRKPPRTKEQLAEDSKENDVDSVAVETDVQENLHGLKRHQKETKHGSYIDAKQAKVELPKRREEMIEQCDIDPKQAKFESDVNSSSTPVVDKELIEETIIQDVQSIQEQLPATKSAFDPSTLATEWTEDFIDKEQVENMFTKLSIEDAAMKENNSDQLPDSDKKAFINSNENSSVGELTRPENLEHAEFVAAYVQNIVQKAVQRDRDQSESCVDTGDCCESDKGVESEDGLASLCPNAEFKISENDLHGLSEPCHLSRDINDLGVVSEVIDLTGDGNEQSAFDLTDDTSVCNSSREHSTCVENSNCCANIDNSSAVFNSVEDAEICLRDQNETGAKQSSLSFSVDNSKLVSYLANKEQVAAKVKTSQPVEAKSDNNNVDEKLVNNSVISVDSSCDNASEASNDSGRGASFTDTISPPAQSDGREIIELNFPSDLCGRLIGKQGKNINYIKDKSGANLTLRANPYTADLQICTIDGTQNEIEKSLDLIQKKFPPNKFPGLDLTPINQASSNNAVLLPDIMQLNLPEGVSVDVVVSSIVDAGHIFIQQPTHPTFPSLERLNQFMLACYTQDGMVPPLPRPLESGVICSAPMLNGWYRAQVIGCYDDTDEADIKYVDYGGFSRVQASLFRQIRSDFMTLPFQAVECCMANITTLQDEEFFSAEAAAVLEELTQGKLLQAQVVGRTDDGTPYVHIYQINGNKALLVNRELVNRGVTRWIEILS